MKKFLSFLIALSLIVWLGYLKSDAAETTQEGAPIRDSQQAEIVEPSSLWIVVNMFTGRTSKQAVIVQETLERLGAEGRGIILPYAEITVRT